MKYKLEVLYCKPWLILTSKPKLNHSLIIIDLKYLDLQHEKDCNWFYQKYGEVYK